MGRDLFDEFSEARAVFEQADAALSRPLSEIIFEGPEDELVRTINTQPAILVTSLACLAAGRATGALEHAPAFVAGHSLGEYSALVAAGALTLADSIQLVQERGRLMQEACDAAPSGMAALIGLEPEVVDEVCAGSGAEVCNINTDTQIVVGGTHEAVAAAVKLATEKGARRAIPLKVGGAFHSSLMGLAAEGMRAALASIDFSAPEVPVVGNMTAQALTSTEAVIDELEMQVNHAVRWRQSVETMGEAGVGSFIEIGPGSALTGMVRSILREAKPELVNLNDAASIREAG
jgi:[acyl-carrier-protein] S-malonyltransferase